MMSARIALLMILVAVFLAVGCSDSTGPVVDDDAIGSVDPGNQSFELATLMVPPPDGGPVPLVLESNGVMSMDDGVTVILEVTVRNAGDRNVGGPLVIWITGFDPADVEAMNPDIVAPGLPGEPMLVGYDYSEFLGDDGVLEPGEETLDKVWEFRDPGQGPFSFTGYAEGGFGPAPARLGGFCFEDVDGDGEPDPDGTPFPMAFINVSTPGGVEMLLHPGPDGRYGMPASEPGLYTLHASIPTMDPLGYFVTTANPLHVVLTSGPESVVFGYEDADFGFSSGDCPPMWPAVEFTDMPADSLHFGSWSLIEASVDHPGWLRMHVGYSGCEEIQDFSMYAVGGFMESFPPQLNLVLVHEEEQDCDAAFQHTYTFDLMHVHRSYMEAYGPGELILNIIGFDGEVAGSVPIFVGLD